MQRSNATLFLVDVMAVLLNDGCCVGGGEKSDVVRDGLWLVVRGS